MSQVEAMKSGLDEYVVKLPAHFIRLPAAVRAALDRAEARRRGRRGERSRSRLDLVLHPAAGRGQALRMACAAHGMRCAWHALCFPDELTCLGTPSARLPPKSPMRTSLDARGRLSTMDLERAMNIIHQGGLAGPVPQPEPHAELDTCYAASASRWHRALRWLRANTFAPVWLPPGWRRPGVSYMLGALVMMVATAATWQYGETFPGYGFRGAFQFVALVVVAVSFGAGPSLLATILGAVLVYVVVLPPQFGLSPADKGADAAGVALYVVVGGVVSLLPSRVERERRQADDERARLEAIFAAMSEGVSLFDLEGRIQRTNAAYRELFGLAMDPSFEQLRILERAQRLAIQDEGGEPVPTDALPISRALRGEILTGLNAVDTRVRTLDGRMLEINDSAAPVFGQDGKVAGAVVVTRDVTERRRLERRTHEALRALLQMAEVLVQTPEEPAHPVAPSNSGAGEVLARPVAWRLAELTRQVLACEHVGIVTVDPGTQVLQPLALVSSTPDFEQAWAERVASSRFDDYLDQPTRERLMAGEPAVLTMPRAAYPGHAATTLPSVLVLPLLIDGQHAGELYVHFGQAHHDYTTDEITLARGAARLTTLVIERQRLHAARAEAARLSDLDRVRSDFIANVSHDLQTPLTSIRAGLGLLDLSAGQRLSPDEQDLLEAARHNADRLRLHIDDLLVATHIEAETLRLEREPLDLRSVIGSAAATMHPLISGKAQSLTLDLPEPLPTVGDGRRLEQVMVNLLANAYRHTPPHTRILVSGRADGGMVRVSVRDNGPGFPTEAQDTIFLRFHRLGDKASGGGLGLAIVRALVERHGGRVWAQSAPGAGAVFHVELPSAPGDAEDWEEEDSANFAAHR